MDILQLTASEFIHKVHSLMQSQQLPQKKVVADLGVSMDAYADRRAKVLQGSTRAIFERDYLLPYGLKYSKHGTIIRDGRTKLIKK